MRRHHSRIKDRKSRSMRILCQRKDRGIALIIVMIVILVLSVLAGGFAYTMKVEMRLAAQSNYDSQMEWLGRSGLELARFALTEQDKLAGPKIHCLSQRWAGGEGLDATNGPLSEISLENNQLGAGSFSIKITDLERKFNINTVQLNPAVLQQAMLVMGVDAATSPTIVDSIVDWLDLDNNALSSGAENDYYLSLNPGYYCKNGLIDDMSELLLVKGITPDVFWGTSSTNNTISLYQPRDDSPSSRMQNERPNYVCGLNDLFTTLSAGRINVNTAPMNTLRMVFGGDENIATAVIRQRAGPDGQDGTADDIPFIRAQDVAANVPGLVPLDGQKIAALCDVRSFTFEVVVDVDVNGYKKQFVGIVRRLNNNAYSVLSFYGK